MEKIKVLIVDDELEILKALKRLLHRDYDVDIFTSGFDAVKALEENSYPVIISDMRMPIMDGAEFLSKAHGLAPTSQKILLTGFSDPMDTSRAVNDGHINFYINKPWQNTTILKALNDAVLAYHQEIKRRNAFYNIKIKNQQLSKNASELEVDLLDHETALNRAEHKNEVALSKIKQTLQRTVNVLSDCAALNEPYSHGHSERVASQLRELGKALGFSNAQISHLVIAGKLHRLGMIGLTDEVLSTPIHELHIDQQIEVVDSLASTCDLLSPFVEFAPSVDIIQQLHQLEREPNTDLDYIDEVSVKSAHALFICSRLDMLMNAHVLSKRLSFHDAATFVKKHYHYINTDILALFEKVREKALLNYPSNIQLSIGVSEARKGMELHHDVIAKHNGQHYIQSPHILTEHDIEQLKTIEENNDSLLVLHIK